MNNNFRQSDNICTVGWRNIWGRFTLEQITILFNAIEQCSMSSTQSSGNWDINHPERLAKYIDTHKGHLYITDKWGFYFDYPEQYHSKVWDIITIWFPMMQKPS